MPQPTSILDAFTDAVRTVKTTIVGQHIWREKTRRRHVCIECGCFRIEYQSKHSQEGKEV